MYVIILGSFILSWCLNSDSSQSKNLALKLEVSEMLFFKVGFLFSRVFSWTYLVWSFLFWLVLQVYPRLEMSATS